MSRWMGRPSRQTEYSKPALNLAFRDFRKAGLIARQNFSCCDGCVGSQIASEIGDRIRKEWETKGPPHARYLFESYRRLTKGCVFYHRQATAALQKDGGVYLKYGNIGVDCVGDIGIGTVEVGRLVTGILTELRIPWEWDGTASQCIWVDVSYRGLQKEQEKLFDTDVEQAVDSAVILS